MQMLPSVALSSPHFLLIRSSLNGTEIRIKAPRADMRESESWRPNIHLYYAESSRNPQAKFQDSLALPFEVLPERVIQTVLEEQGVNYRQTLHATSGVGMDVSSPRFDKSLSNVNRVIAWLAAAGERFPQPIPEPTAKPANACPVSVETLVQANCRSPTSGGEAGAAVVGDG